MLFFGLVVLIVCLLQVQSLNFLAVGDWGGDENPPYYTEGQMASVAGMEKIAQQLQSQFVLAVGDNFYHSGVTSDTDSRFQTTFESVYNTPGLQTKWYAIAGNHDHYGNVSAQIAYTAESARWNFPSPYHAHNFRSKDGASLDVIMIDTVDLAYMNAKKEDEEGYFDPLPLRSKDNAAEQWAWIEAQLKLSKADYVLVVGHYPVYSACAHGNTETLIKHLRPLLNQYGAHYLSGHDHCMEHMAETETPVNYFLSGMGAECCYKPVRKGGVPEGFMKWYIADDNRAPGVLAGFSSFEVTKDAMLVKYYDQAGNTLYSVPKISPRTSK